MQDRKLLSPDAIRAEFSAALSSMYRKEVPKYGLLMDLVADINAEVLQDQPSLRAALLANESLARLDQERHGAIRLGTEEELAVVCRMFAVMGMEPVGYYDLGPAGVPVHSTAFRPISTSALAANPFRMFTSLLRLPLVEDPTLRDEAAAILARRRIFTPKALELLALAETQGGWTRSRRLILSRRSSRPFVGMVTQLLIRKPMRACWRRIVSWRMWCASVGRTSII